MAAGGGDMKGAYNKFLAKGKTELTSKDMTRWCKDAGVFGKSCSSNNMDIAFAKCKPKGKPALPYANLDALCAELAKTYKTDHKCADDNAAKAELCEKLAAAGPKAHGATKVSADDATKRMTDASKYTGAHKERFDESGKGKGLEGREDRAENTGYVGDYKGADTYDKKH